MNFYRALLWWSTTGCLLIATGRRPGLWRTWAGACVLTIMTWNVENFFTPKPADQAAYDAKVTELAAVISTAAPDLLALQEVGDAESFEALRVALGAGWTGVLSTHFESPHAIRVGWLSRGALSDVDRRTTTPASAKAATNSSTTSWSPTPWSATSTTPPPCRSTCPASASNQTSHPEQTHPQTTGPSWPTSTCDPAVVNTPERSLGRRTCRHAEAPKWARTRAHY